MIIAIDGPAASGKGTLGKRIAAHYGLIHLDTGKLYRAVARDTLAAGASPADEAAATGRGQGARSRDFGRSVSDGRQARRGRLHRRQPPCGAGRPARLSARLRPAQARRGARRPRHRHRDLPRRRREAVRHRRPPRSARGAAIASCARPATAIAEAEVLADIRRRDERDKNRAAAPLRQAEDAYLLDTTNLDIDAAFKAAIALIDAAMGRAGQAG